MSLAVPRRTAAATTKLVNVPDASMRKAFSIVPETASLSALRAVLIVNVPMVLHVPSSPSVVSDESCSVITGVPEPSVKIWRSKQHLR